MLQKVMDLFNIVLFGEYLFVSLVFTVIMVKLYFTTLRRIVEGKSYKMYIAIAITIYALVIGFMIHTIVAYGFLSTTVTSVVMYAVMYYPMKKFTKWIEEKGTEIALS